MLIAFTASITSSDETASPGLCTGSADGTVVRAVAARQFGGLGVGLWLARQIIEAHGGKLEVQSDIGVGSTFTIELPGVA